jgi:hypothetical protein
MKKGEGRWAGWLQRWATEKSYPLLGPQVTGGPPAFNDFLNGAIGFQCKMLGILAPAPETEIAGTFHVLKTVRGADSDTNTSDPIKMIWSAGSNRSVFLRTVGVHLSYQVMELSMVGMSAGGSEASGHQEWTQCAYREV